MSTEARHAPIPPRPTPTDAPEMPPETTATSEKTEQTGTTDDTAKPAADGAHTAKPAHSVPPPRPTSPPAAPPGTPDGGADRSGASAPPPPASARFPDTPPAAGFRPRRTGTSDPARPGGADRHPGRSARPPHPGHPPAVPPRPSGPPATPPPETTGRPRATPSEPGPGSDRGPGRPLPPSPPARPGAATVPPRPTVRPGSTAVPAGPQVGAWRPDDFPGGPLPGRTEPAAAPDPALSWSAFGPPGGERPVVSFGQPEGYDDRARPRPLGVRLRPRTAAAAACLVLGLGLIGGAVTGSWLTGDAGATGGTSGFAAAGALWHSVPVDELFPPTVEGKGAGPGGADRTWTRIAVAPDSGCVNAFDPLLRKLLDPLGCERLLRATYTDATQSHVTTVGLLFAKADPAAMSALAARFKNERLDRRADLMPRPYAAADTVAAGFGDEQRGSWTISVLTDAPVVAYAVSGWADGRTVDAPQPAADAQQSGATTAPAQAGLGQEAQGLADRIERRLRQTVSPATERPS
ncbi:hypothetical protein ACIQGO_22130 [Streptomyces shenzhenensis]|uniref:hypothetical protein n=1 Tax=Streptomyces shenzhenensis TaxID=943815 RepID=UPI0037FF229A